jgi:hypothetical protein
VLWERFFVLASADSAGLFSRKAKASLETASRGERQKKVENLVYFATQQDYTVCVFDPAQLRRVAAVDG